MTPAQVPHLRVTVEDGLYERPVTRSVPGGLAREGRPVAARYLFNLGEPVTTGDAELVTGGMEQSRTPNTNHSVAAALRELSVCLARLADALDQTDHTCKHNQRTDH